jgi:hypothetical protein
MTPAGHPDHDTKISCDQNYRVSLPELPNNSTSFFLIHIAMYAGHCEIFFNHFFVNFSTFVLVLQRTTA